MDFEEKQREFLRSALDELYQNSTPPIGWGMVELLYSGTGEHFTDKHTIPEKKYDELVAKYTKLAKIKHFRGLSMTLLDYAPRVIYDDNP